MQELGSDFLCCDVAEAANEPMMGTAVAADVWFMLEYTRPWGAKATSENELPVEVMRWLGDEGMRCNGRLQFIRQFRPEAEEIAFFIGVAGRLYRFDLAQYEDLLGLDVTAVIKDDPRYLGNLIQEKQYFICTNGKRDRSCAIRGAASFREFAAQAGDAVWMTTHLGGHRFAPTLLSLPDGVCYGRIHAQDVGQFLAFSRRNVIWLDKLRGQSRYQTVEQVADYFLRRETGWLAEGAFVLLDMLAESDGWQVRFQNKDGQISTVTIALADSIFAYPNSNKTVMKEILQYQLIRIASNF